MTVLNIYFISPRSPTRIVEFAALYGNPGYVGGKGRPFSSSRGSGISSGGGSLGTGGNGKLFSNMNVQRGAFGLRKKITRSASLEEDEEVVQRRQRESGIGERKHSHELARAGMVHGKGVEGSMAVMAGYVRSQSVTDEVLSQRRSGSGTDVYDTRCSRCWSDRSVAFVFFFSSCPSLRALPFVPFPFWLLLLWLDFWRF